MSHSSLHSFKQNREDDDLYFKILYIVRVSSNVIVFSFAVNADEEEELDNVSFFNLLIDHG